MIKPNLTKIEFQGENLNLTQWIDKLGLQVPRKVLYNRYFKLGWHPDRVFSSEGTQYAKRIDNAVEAYNEIMAARGYFSKENRTKAYKQLKKDYEYFNQQGQMRIAV